MAIFYNFFLSGVDSSLVNHPAHLLDSNNNSLTSAFIPFCAFNGQLGIPNSFSPLTVGSFPVCTSFNPVALDGQLCYNIKLNNVTSNNRRTDGLILILDLNEDRLVPLGMEEDNDQSNVKLIFNPKDQGAKKAAKLHINTLSSFKGFGAGEYKMTSVKKLIGTEDFLSMPDNTRNCKLEDYEDCRRRELFQVCNCSLSELISIQVGLTNR